MPTLSSAAAREVVHLLVLQELVGLSGRARVTVKGGVNLRLFFGSIRYSEDMDLDGTADASAAIRDCLKQIFDDRGFLQRLRGFGLRGLDPGEGPNEDTETTFRYKFGVMTGGEVREPTKVEVSFRESHAADRAVPEAPNRAIMQAYGLDRFEVHHYVREAAIRQKIDALGGRRAPQARDIFDIHMLVPNGHNPEMLAFLAESLSHQRLSEAHERALAVSYGEYEGQVFEFLETKVKSQYATEDTWAETRLRVAALIEDVMKRQRPA